MKAKREPHWSRAGEAGEVEVGGAISGKTVESLRERDEQASQEGDLGSLLALAAVLFLAMTRSILVAEMYEAIDWRIVTMIIGMIALGTAVEGTGTARWLAGGAVSLAGDVHPILILAVVYLITTTLTEMISNNAVAILMTPIAMKTAIAYDLNPLPFFIAIMFAASASFATPIGYQTNTFVYGAGGYRFSDFLRVGCR